VPLGGWLSGLAVRVIPYCRHATRADDAGMDVRTPRFATGLTVALLGSFTALIFGGAQIGTCLGLGVTVVQCAAHGGGLPTMGAVVPDVIVAWSVGLLVAMGAGLSGRNLVPGTVGLALGVGWYFATRPTSILGPDYDGTWLVVPLPIEPASLVTWGISGLLLLLLTVCVGDALLPLKGKRDRDG
jgi:hypothetical protein